MAKPKSAAIITIKRPSSMTPKGRSEIAKWLRKQAAYFAQYGDQYAEDRYRARYLYE